MENSVLFPHAAVELTDQKHVLLRQTLASRSVSEFVMYQSPVNSEQLH